MGGNQETEGALQLRICTAAFRESGATENTSYCIHFRFQPLTYHSRINLYIMQAHNLELKYIFGI